MNAPPAYSLPTNRLRAVLLHVPWYTIEGAARLATDVGVSRSTISRLLGGRQNPSFHLADSIATAVSKRARRTVEAREIFSRSGTYPTASACTLMGCAGCLPPDAYDERSDRLKATWLGTLPGEWCRYPSTRF